MLFSFTPPHNLRIILAHFDGKRLVVRVSENNPIRSPGLHLPYDGSQVENLRPNENTSSFFLRYFLADVDSVVFPLSD